MCRKLFVLLTFFVVLGLVGANSAFGDVIEVRIAAELDASEEDINPSKLGEVDADSSDLEMPYEDGGMVDPQFVGLRYQVAIPKGAVITNAWVRFQVDQLKAPENTLPVNLIIEGELSPNPGQFVDGGPGTFDISSRPRTTTQVQWSVPAWEAENDQGPAQTTVDISPVIQEIIDQDGWVSGNALVLIFSDDPTNPSGGLRCAESFRDEPDGRPLLHVDFTAGGAPAGGGTGEMLFEFWYDIGGTAVADLTGQADYPDNPDGGELRPSFDSIVDGPDNYGVRARGYVYPPADGDYTFWVSGDDFVELYLSTDADPANAVMIAEVPGWTSYLEWNKYPEQQSAPITLVGGQKYYIEGIMKEAGGGDSLTAYWAGPEIGDEHTIIDGAFLSPADWAPGNLKAKAVVPADGAVDVDVTALEWAAGKTAVSHTVYLSADEMIDDADLLGTTDLTIQIAILDDGTTYYWRVDETDADGNVIEGDVWSFATIPLEAHFPVPEDGARSQALNAQLSWAAGKIVIMHDVYFGTDEAAIAARDMTTFKGKLMDASYDPGPLDVETTYYWAVDEFAPPPTGTVAGPVWSFTTLGSVPITDPDLLLYYDFELGEGTTALDQSGHSNHGQFKGSPQWVDGAVSINIDTLDYIETAAPLGIVSNTVSVTGWVKHDESPAAWSGILTHRGTSPGNVGLQHNGVELRYMWGADVYWDFSSGLEMPNGEWYFAAVTISPDQGKLYLNGIEQTATNVAPHEPTNFDSLIRVGRDHSDDRIMTSLIDEVRFYNRTLTDVEILALAKPNLVDVTAPGDVVKGVPDEPRDGSVAGWPDGEYPWLAVDDDVSTKFLHFRGEVSPTGFVVEPAMGLTIVTGMTLTTANDATERDPASYEISGSNVSIDGPYELIAAGDVVDFAQADVWPRFTMNATAISFDNAVVYRYYQVMFPTVRDAGSANSMQIAEVELLGVGAPDVTAPGDTVRGVPNDGDWPGAESPDLAIDDNSGTKYLHRKGGAMATGFQVEPSMGKTIVNGLTLTTANDVPTRDPITFELSGSNDSMDGPYEAIAAGDVADFAQADDWPRFTMNTTAISFENAAGYKYYQVVFPTLRGETESLMQIAEVELLGVPAPKSIIWVDGDYDDNGDGAVDDLEWVDILKAEGYAVDNSESYVELDDAKIAALNAADLIIVSRNSNSGDYDDGDEIAQWNAITTPIINSSTHIVRSSRWKFVDSTSILSLAPATMVLADGTEIPGINADVGPASFIDAAPGNGTVLATGDGLPFIIEWEAGVEYYDGAGEIAGGPRMFFAAGTQEDTAAVPPIGRGEMNLTAEALAVFLDAVSNMIAAAEEPVNILANGGLEDDLTGAGWGTYGDASMEVVSELVDAAVPDVPIEGSNCLHVTVNSAGANFWDAGLQHGGHVFEAGKSYTLSAWFKSKSGPFQINIKPERAADPWEGYGSQEITITEEWDVYAVNTGVIPETVDPASITFHIAYAPGEFWVDDAVFTED